MREIRRFSLREVICFSISITTDLKTFSFKPNRVDADALVWAGEQRTPNVRSVAPLVTSLQSLQRVHRDRARQTLA
jgi:hypothetical protein